jgi:hypothetical protein
MTEPDLSFIARQLERVLQELANLRRDAVDVLTAMSVRHESSVQTVVQELQAIHRHNARTNERFRKLEDPELSSKGPPQMS